MSLPITAYVSILHRISGIVLLGGIILLLWMLDTSLSSEQGFNELKETLSSPLMIIIIWGLLAGLAYHTIAGIRHLLMDIGIGETLEGGRLGAKIVALLAVLAILAIGVFLIW